MIKQFEDLKGQILSKIENIENEELVFTLANGEKCKLYHQQDCCESVSIEDINGDLNDFLNSPLLVAEESSNSEDNPPKYSESFTWTFYRLATMKGWVVIRWLGESNGYYSEHVDFCKVIEE